MDYIAFLIRSGFAPYRDIVDMNMPGAYLLQLLQTGILGSGSVGLLGWVSLEIAAVIAASIWIAGTERPWAGIAAGCLTSLIHLSHGAWNLGQRDWDVAVLLLVCCAFLLSYFRSGHYWPLAAAFLFGGFASTIKPQAILFPILGAVYLCAVKGRSKRRSAAAALAGLSVPTLCVLLFLAKYHAFGAFLFDTRRLAGYYASLAHPGFDQLGRNLLISEWPLVVICLAAVPLYIRQKLWHSVRINLIGIGVVFGVASYFLQNKGWTYHQLPAWAFVSLWLALVIDAALREKSRWPAIVASCLTLAVLLMGPIFLFAQVQARYPLETVTHLQRDLVQLGAQSGEVQCLDMTAAGCVNVLERLRSKQATGFIYDFYFFPQRATALTAELQDRFLSKISAHPPRLIVLSSHIWPGDRFGYGEVSVWPAFASFLSAHYRIAREYEPEPQYRHVIAGYRIYLFKCDGSYPCTP